MGREQRMQDLTLAALHAAFGNAAMAAAHQAAAVKQSKHRPHQGKREMERRARRLKSP